MEMNDESLLMGHKLNMHLDTWAAEKRELEDRIGTNERTQSHKQASQAHENARLDITLGLQQQELQLSTFKLETALDDVAVSQTRVALLKTQLQRAKEDAEKLRKQGRAQESYFVSKEAEFDGKLREALEKKAMVEARIQELQQQIQQENQQHEAEISRERTKAENCKERLANALPSLLSERDSLWLQLKNVEADYSSLDKLKDEQLLLALDEICKLEQRIERAKTEAEKYERVVNALKADPHSMANYNEVELDVRKVLDRVDEIKLENEKLSGLCGEMETKLEHHQEASNRQRVSRQNVATLNLSAEQNVGAAQQKKGSVIKDTRKTKRKQCENRENLNQQLDGSMQGKRQSSRKKGSTLSQLSSAR